jgi:ABC-type hemin transport system ATPase subunit
VWQGVRRAAQPASKREAQMAGQLALSTDEKMIAAAAVWKTLPPGVQQRVTLQLARLLARLVEGERDE